MWCRPRSAFVRLSCSTTRSGAAWIYTRVLTATPLFIEPGSPWENGYVQSFNGKLRDELLTGELFYTLHEAQVLVERRWQRYNVHRSHSALGYRPLAPDTRTVAPIRGLSA